MLKPHDITGTPTEVRNTFKSSSDWKSRCASLKAGHPDCALCGEPIRYDLRKPHPLSFSVDHKPGYRCEEQVGKEAWECKRICTQLEGLQPAHYGCNSADSVRRGFPHYIPASREEPDELAPVEYINQRTGEHETFFVNSRTMVGPDWKRAA